MHQDRRSSARTSGNGLQRVYGSSRENARDARRGGQILWDGGERLGTVPQPAAAHIIFSAQRNCLPFLVVIALPDHSRSVRGATQIATKRNACRGDRVSARLTPHLVR